MAITLDGTAGITTPDLTDSSLTAGRVVYAGTGGNLTSSANLTFDGASVGVGVTPNAWSVLGSGMQLKGGGSVVGRTDTVTQTNYTLNGFFNGTDWKYIESTTATRYMQYVGAHSWYTAPAGTAGNTITFTQVLGVEAGKSLALEGATSQTGVGITFPATQVASSNANTLDDYEEGTWTPVIAFGGASVGITYSAQSGNYTKIGNRVLVSCYVALSNKGSSTGAITITGLPFTSANTSFMFNSMSIAGFNLASISGSLQAYNAPNTSTVSEITYLGTGTHTGLTNTNCNNNSSFMINFSYSI